VLGSDPAVPGDQTVEPRPHRYDQYLLAVAVLPDGRVVSGGDDHRVRLWDPAAPAGPPVELGRHDSWVHSVAVLPDGRVVTGGHDHRVRLWDPTTREQCAEIQLSCTAISATATGPKTASIAMAQSGELPVWST
jgi:WD40 repeat protein